MNGLGYVPRCRDCRWLEGEEQFKARPKLGLPDCLRPDRMIYDMVSGNLMLTADVSALADRTCAHPGACGREAKFFEPKP